MPRACSGPGSQITQQQEDGLEWIQQDRAISGGEWVRVGVRTVRQFECIGNEIGLVRVMERSNRELELVCDLVRRLAQSSCQLRPIRLP